MKKIACRHTTTFILIFVAGLIAGVVSGRLFHAYTDNHDVSSKQVREMGDFHFTNPLLECEISEGMIDAPKINFKNDLIDFVADKKRITGISEVAVYYRDLNNGPAFGVNETTQFIPASLLKLPVAMAYCVYAEDVPDVMSKKLTLNEEYDITEESTQIIRPSREIAVGNSYRIDELIEHMLVYSDNQAVTLLIEHLPPEYIRDLYRVLGVSSGVLDGPEGRLSVREYASFFRILFNSSYVSRQKSENILKVLSETEFDEGIVAKLPKDITVSHKFGEGGYQGDHQIHDCGIVYLPGKPYLLCIMTRGKSIELLKSTIADTSRFVYDRILEEAD
jgi:beta-lactamase class A